MLILFELDEKERPKTASRAFIPNIPSQIKLVKKMKKSTVDKLLQLIGYATKALESFCLPTKNQERFRQYSRKRSFILGCKFMECG